MLDSIDAGIASCVAGSALKAGIPILRADSDTQVVVGGVMRKALVRPPGYSYRNALTEQVPRPVIDVSLALDQHGEYCAALRTAGLELITLPPDERYPDACFVQDTAVVFGDMAVISRPGAESRRGEQEAVRAVLEGQLRLAELRYPATLEGGDVLIIGTSVYVGLSARTNRAGFAQLREHLELEGATVQTMPVSESLHLLSDCTYLGRGVLLATEVYAEASVFAGLDVIRVPMEEAYAANALGIGDFAILPAGCPSTEAQVRERGFEVLAVSLSEFAKADGGVTCLSLPF